MRPLFAALSILFATQASANQVIQAEHLMMGNVCDQKLTLPALTLDHYGDLNQFENLQRATREWAAAVAFLFENLLKANENETRLIQARNDLIEVTQNDFDWKVTHDLTQVSRRRYKVLRLHDFVWDQSKAKFGRWQGSAGLASIFGLGLAAAVAETSGHSNLALLAGAPIIVLLFATVMDVSLFELYAREDSSPLILKFRESFLNSLKYQVIKIIRDNSRTDEISLSTELKKIREARTPNEIFEMGFSLFPQPSNASSP